MTAPLGNLSLAENYLRLALADSSTFRTWVGAANQSEALDDIYQTALPPPSKEDYTLAELEGYRPYAIIWTHEAGGFTRTREAVSDHYEYNVSGSIMIRLEQDVPSAIADDPSEITLQWQNIIGQIIDDLCELFGKAGYLTALAIRLEEGAYRSHPDDAEKVGDFVGALLRVDWGP